MEVLEVRDRPSSSFEEKRVEQTRKITWEKRFEQFFRFAKVFSCSLAILQLLVSSDLCKIESYGVRSPKPVVFKVVFSSFRTREVSLTRVSSIAHYYPVLPQSHVSTYHSMPGKPLVKVIETPQPIFETRARLRLTLAFSTSLLSSSFVSSFQQPTASNATGYVQAYHLLRFGPGSRFKALLLAKHDEDTSLARSQRCTIRDESSHLF